MSTVERNHRSFGGGPMQNPDGSMRNACPEPEHLAWSFKSFRCVCGARFVSRDTYRTHWYTENSRENRVDLEVERLRRALQRIATGFGDREGVFRSDVTALQMIAQAALDGDS